MPLFVNVASPPLHPYPAPDFDREGRLVQDVIDLMHGTDNDDFKRKVKRWLTLVLQDAGRRRRWWFLEHAVTTTLGPGDDVIDLKGHLDRVIAVFAPERLTKAPLSTILEKRLTASRDNLPNAGPQPTQYALEAGRRLHLWPAPDRAVQLGILYARPLHVALVPDEWESILLNGVIGKYGRHYDRDALLDKAGNLEERFEHALRNAGSDSWDIDRLQRWTDDLASGTVAAASTNGEAYRFTAPASLRGVGAVQVELGDYPLEVA